MPEQSEQKEQYVQIGFTALRDPVTGQFLPKIPLYIKTENAETGKTGLPETEESALYDIGRIFAMKFKEYVRAGRRLAKNQKASEKVEAENAGGDMQKKRPV
jgi:hypothetical protein